MAAPVVAGIAAILKATDPNWQTFPTPHDLLDRIAETSVDKRYENPRWADQERLRRVDALCAVTNNLNCPIPFP
jgi:hypothetical protein